MRPLLFLAIVALSSACTSFANVRSAVVNPGPSLSAQGSATTKVGEVAGWFFSDECTACNDGVLAPEAVLAYGHAPRTGRSFAIGIGVSGIFPFAEAYVQLANGSTPIGLGTRVAWLDKWKQYQLHARIDRNLSNGRKLLWNPGFFMHDGRAPNDQNPGTMLALVNGFGVEFGSGPVAFTPSISVVASRAERESGGIKYGPENAVFAQAALSLTLRRAPERRD